MATNRNIKSAVEYYTGKRVCEYYHDPLSFLLRFLFDDDTEGTLSPEQDISEIKITKKFEYFCVSCGEPGKHISYFDQQGRCEITIKNFWNKARKLFWHRYIENKPKP